MRWKWIRPSSIYTAENLCRYHRLLLPLDMVMYSCSGKGEIHITDLIRNCLSSESSGDSSSEGIWEERERDEGSSSNQFIISVLSGGRHSKCWEACRACCDHRSIQCKSTCQSRQLLLCPGTLLEISLGGGDLELFLLSLNIARVHANVLSACNLEASQNVPWPIVGGCGKWGCLKNS